ncbi:hypothetical protein [Hymenobacter radiodurans]|uniref:hypothetical protein n=1 Tax=Hymenobacter radiodurans TaxID=2496028 RepID=UPI0010584F34|nr:hypothetical protein [Hymenobacter radiodurans]
MIIFYQAVYSVYLNFLFSFLAVLLLSCGTRSVGPVITAQQIACLNKDKAWVQQSITAQQQTFVGREQDVYLFTTPQGAVLGYLFEQGECSTVMTQVPAGRLAQAEAFIAAEVKKNFGPMLISPANVHYKLYTAPIWQDTETYVVAQALN